MLYSLRACESYEANYRGWWFHKNGIWKGAVSNERVLHSCSSSVWVNHTETGRLLSLCRGTESVRHWDRDRQRRNGDRITHTVLTGWGVPTRFIQSESWGLTLVSSENERPRERVSKWRQVRLPSHAGGCALNLVLWPNKWVQARHYIHQPLSLSGPRPIGSASHGASGQSIRFCKRRWREFELLLIRGTRLRG